ncbi:MAG: MerR family transcriptional regulator [Bacteroidales bacterium]|nr:MerR family transcriptional regulator [Bacteroidales bacterium]
MSKKNNTEKVFFSIGEVASATGTTPSAIRYWEKNFPELSPKKSEKGTRFYTSADIETVKLINHLVREKGMTIKGVKQKLKQNRDETLKIWELIDKLQNIKKILTEIKDEMEEGK